MYSSAAAALPLEVSGKGGGAREGQDRGSVAVGTRPLLGLAQGLRMPECGTPHLGCDGVVRGREAGGRVHLAHQDCYLTLRIESTLLSRTEQNLARSGGQQATAVKSNQKQVQGPWVPSSSLSQSPKISGLGFRKSEALTHETPSLRMRHVFLESEKM